MAKKGRKFRGPSERKVNIKAELEALGDAVKALNLAARKLSKVHEKLKPMCEFVRRVPSKKK